MQMFAQTKAKDNADHFCISRHTTQTLKFHLFSFIFDISFLRFAKLKGKLFILLSKEKCMCEKERERETKKEIRTTF